MSTSAEAPHLLEELLSDLSLLQEDPSQDADDVNVSSYSHCRIFLYELQLDEILEQGCKCCSKNPLKAVFAPLKILCATRTRPENSLTRLATAHGNFFEARPICTNSHHIAQLHAQECRNEHDRYGMNQRRGTLYSQTKAQQHERHRPQRAQQPPLSLRLLRPPLRATE